MNSKEAAAKLRECFLWAKVGGQEPVIVGIRQGEGFYEEAIATIIRKLEAEERGPEKAG